MKTLILAILMIGTLLASDKHKIQTMDKSSTLESVKMQSMQNGKVYSKKVYVLTDKEQKVRSDSSVKKYTYADGKTFNSQSSIIITLKPDSSPSIQELAKKYNLEVVKKLYGSTYLLKQYGDDTLNVVNRLIQIESTNIKSITPNLRLNMKPR